MPHATDIYKITLYSFCMQEIDSSQVVLVNFIVFLHSQLLSMALCGSSMFHTSAANASHPLPRLFHTLCIFCLLWPFHAIFLSQFEKRPSLLSVLSSSFCQLSQGMEWRGRREGCGVCESNLSAHACVRGMCASVCTSPPLLAPSQRTVGPT